MSIIIYEKDIISQKTPNGEPWTESQIRQYQEGHGINYGQAVFERGQKPNRSWSNDRTFGVEQVQINPPVAVQPTGQNADSEEVAMLKHQIDELRAMLKPTIPSVIKSVGVDRHTKPLDKRSKEYRDSLKKA